MRTGCRLRTAAVPRLPQVRLRRSRPRRLSRPQPGDQPVLGGRRGGLRRPGLQAADRLDQPSPELPAARAGCCYSSGGRYYRFRDTAFPERGGLARVEADYTTGSDDVRCFRYSAELQRFFTLFFRNRILGIRARLDRAHGLGDGIVPYSDLPGLGGDQRLRGYRRGFFRGAGSLLLSAEYRYPVWDTCNAFLFREEGQVFDRYGDLEAGRFEHGYGAGISVRTERDFLFGAYVARSREEKALTGFLVEKEF